MNLRDLTSDQEAILAQVESGDFTLDDVSDHLELLENERNQKIENYLHVINNIEVKLKAKTDEIKRIEAMRDAEANALANIKAWLLMSMQDGEKHEFDLFKVSRVKGHETVNVIDESKISELYFNEVPASKKLDKRSLLSALKTGSAVDGAEITTGKPSLRIK